MMDDNRKKVKNNLLYGFAGQIIMVVVSIVLPRLIIVSFGSDMNGLVSSITQIFTYIALLEAGIGNASLNLLYKNIAHKDKNEINVTLSATQVFFRKLTPVYAAAVVLFVIVYPMVVKTEIASMVIRAIIVIQGAAGVINFYCTNTFTQLLIADGRNYVVSNLNLVQKILSTILQIILIVSGFDIIAVQLLHLVLTVLKAVAVNIYTKRQYGWIKLSRKGDTGILEQRGAFAVHEFSNVIFQSTDIFVLSTFCSTALASVYSIYNLVFSNLNTFLGLFNKGFDFILGQEYNRDEKNYVRFHDAYETIYMALVFATMTTACILTLPFVRLYTKGVSDINYVDAKLPFLFAVIQLLSCCRAVSAKLITISNHARNTVPNTMIEAGLNLSCSLILVQFMGIYGVLCGTIIALLYRTNDIIIYANTRILKRKPLHTYKNMLLYFGLFFVFLFMFQLIHISCPSYLSLFLNAVWIALIVFGTYGVIALACNRGLAVQVKRILLRR